MKSKILFTLLLAGFGLFSLSAQMDRSERKSPPAKAEQKIGKATVVINYSQPSARKRKIYGDLVPYGKVWRTGANEATTFETNQDLMINGKKLPAGKYALFTIPGENEWTIIFNKKHQQWGAFDYDESLNVLTLKARPEKIDHQEKMTFDINKNGEVHLDWANTRVPFTIKG